MEHPLSKLPVTCHAALSVLNNLPGLSKTKFVVETDITDDKVELVANICHLLKDTHCALVLMEKFVELRTFHMSFYKQNNPEVRVQAGVLAIFRHHGWTVCDESETASVE